MLISKVIGHNQAKRILQNALNEKRVAHAYLFHGPAGVGKTTLARAFAGALLCMEGDSDACGVCSACRRYNGGQLPDFSILSPSGNNIKIEQVRELQKKAQFKPYEARRKVYLIEQAETMTIEAANCMLKLLEEPPVNTVFLLTTVNLYNLLPTIISRCLLIPLSRIPAAEIEQMLVATDAATVESAPVLAALADGLPGVALDMAQSGKGLAVRDCMFELVEQISSFNINQLLKTAEEFDKKKETLPAVLEYLLSWYRDQLIWLETGDDQLVVNIDRLSQIKSDAGQAGKNLLMRNIADILEVKNQVGRNVNFRLALEVLMLKLSPAAQNV